MSIATSAILIMGFIIIYAVLVQIYSVLFRLTGLTREKASFQAISLLTNCGFTTQESEVITDDKTRRKIAKAAMITGYIFSVLIVSLIINLIVKLNSETATDTLFKIMIAFILFAITFIVLKIPFVKGIIEKFIASIATLIFFKNRLDNKISLLDMYGKNAIVEIYLNKVPKFLHQKSLFESGIKELYGVNVLMIKRKNRVMDVTKNTIVERHDRLVLFGSYENIKNAFNDDLMYFDNIAKTNTTNEISILDNYGNMAMCEITINKLPNILVNKCLFESPIKSIYGINVIVLKRNKIVLEITKDTILENDDKIVAYGNFSKILELFEIK